MLTLDVSVALYMIHFLQHFLFREQLALTLQLHSGVAGVGFSF